MTNRIRQSRWATTKRRSWRRDAPHAQLTSLLAFLASA
jgi:hypothetical protein